MGRCKHDIGWCCKEMIEVFIFPNGKVSFNFGSRDLKKYKIKFICNYPDCNSERNVYIKGNVVTYGKITKR
jgi:hypothetical protein